MPFSYSCYRGRQGALAGRTIPVLYHLLLLSLTAHLSEQGRGLATTPGAWCLVPPRGPETTPNDDDEIYGVQLPPRLVLDLQPGPILPRGPEVIWCVRQHS